MEFESNSDTAGPTRWAFPARSADGASARRRLSRPVVAVGVTALLAGAGAGAAFAVSGSGSSGTPQAASVAASGGTSTTTPSSPPAARHHHGMGGDGMMGGGMFGGARGIIHGQGTVRTPTGFKTVDIQSGRVDSVSSTSLTVISADNFKQTYTIVPSTVVDSQAGGISSVQKGDTVRVLAEPSGSTLTATNVTDRTRLGDSGRGFGFGPPAGAPGGAAPGTGGPSTPSAPLPPAA